MDASVEFIYGLILHWICRLIYSTHTFDKSAPKLFWPAIRGATGWVQQANVSTEEIAVGRKHGQNKQNLVKLQLACIESRYLQSSRRQFL